MFKKNEESEWTRFSRALGGSSSAPAQPEEAEALDDADDPVTISQSPAATDEVYAAPAPAPEPVQEEPRRPAPPPAPAGAAQVERPASLEGDETVIGAGAAIDGTVRSERSIRVRGSVQGEIECSQRVVVDEEARVQARIVAEHVTILGEVNGAIECSGRVEIASTGRVIGEVTAGTLVIQEGAVVEGHLKMAASRAEA